MHYMKLPLQICEFSNLIGQNINTQNQLYSYMLALNNKKMKL